MTKSRTRAPCRLNGFSENYPLKVGPVPLVGKNRFSENAPWEPWEARGRSGGMSAHKSGATLEQNAKVPLTCQFYDVFLRVGITKYCKLQ